MIKIEYTEVFGLAGAIRGMRNPMNSWDKSDSGLREEFDETGTSAYFYRVGDADLALMKQLVKAGSDHRKFMRMINVQCDIVAPLYWWKEFDTYKVGTVRNSCSTMHKIMSKQFELDDFSHEHLIPNAKKWLVETIKALNNIMEAYLSFYDRKEIIRKQLNLPDTATEEECRKEIWWQVIQLLPESYNQRSTVQMNYEMLRNAYHSRKNHKQDEWRIGFCRWVESLPYSELITDD